MLTEYRALVDQWAADADGEIAEDAFVFSPHVDASTPFRPDNVTGFFMRVRDDIGRDGIRLHDLRHFTAPQLIGAGVDVRTVAERFGHSDASLILRVYSHVLEERERAAAAVMGRVLRPPVPVVTPPKKRRVAAKTP